MRAAPPRAFTAIDLAVTVAVAAVLLLLVLPAFARARQRARRIDCTCHLKQIGLAFKTWSLDHTNTWPLSVSAHAAASRPARGDAFRCFQSLSNELSTPLILVCPADTRAAAKDFGPGFSRSNVSYFLNLDATDSNPQMLLAGDRNLTNGTAPLEGILVLTTNSAVGWTRELHDRNGNVLLSDGSVQQLSSAPLWLQAQAGGANRLALP